MENTHVQQRLDDRDVLTHDWDSVWLQAARLAVAGCSCGWYQVGDNPRSTHRALGAHLGWPQP